MKKYLSKMSKKELEKVLLTHEEFLQFIYNNRMSYDIQDEMLEYIIRYKLYEGYYYDDNKIKLDVRYTEEYR